MFYILFIIFAIGISLLVGRTLWNEIAPALSGKLDSNAALNLVNTMDASFAVFDYIFLFIGIGIGLGIVILAFMTESHPVFAFISLLFVAIALLLAAPFSNVFIEFANKGKLAAASANYPLMVTFMTNYPLFIMSIGFLLLIALYGKVRGGSARLTISQ